MRTHGEQVFGKPFGQLVDPQLGRSCAGYLGG